LLSDLYITVIDFDAVSVAGVNASAFVERLLNIRTVIYRKSVAGVNASAFVERARSTFREPDTLRVAGVNASAFVER